MIAVIHEGVRSHIHANRITIECQLLSLTGVFAITDMRTDKTPSLKKSKNQIKSNKNTNNNNNYFKK